MEQHDFLQGSPEWHAHRATHFNASDAPAMLGISPYKTRSQLLDELATGITPEVDEATQRRFDDGHRFEALARPVAEKIIGRKLYPIVGTEGKLSASFDGLTMDEAICFEHKSLNGAIRAVETAADIPEYIRAQMEQQLMVSGAKTCLFLASNWNADGELVEEIHVYYDPDQAMRDRLLQGWTQFAIDIENYKPRVTAEMPKAEVSIELPALFINAHGSITSSNMEAYGIALKSKLAEVRKIKLITDQDFSNAKEAAKMFREQCQKLKLAKEAMLAQTVSIGEAAQMMDAWGEDLRTTALQLEKDVEKEDLAKKRLMVTEAALAFAAHVEALETETRPIQLNLQKPDFAAVIKGKRNYTSMQDAIDTELASAKIVSDAVAKDVRTKLAWCKETSAGFGFLFADLSQIITKPLDDFKLVVTTRITEHKAAEAAKLEAERMRIQAEEEVKARAKVEAEQRAAAEAEAIEGRRKAVALAEQERALATKHHTPPESQAVTLDGAQPSLVKTEPAAPVTAKVIPILESAPIRPLDIEIIDAVAEHFGVEYQTAKDWVLEVAENLAVAA
ncbi:lambda-exonuclease family protein [Sideroxydans lithotrophicus]|uniref:Phage-type endonuclease n=1 Tax=Sideroxydans lithotrophicus (strain ES-1) TaxID=580332 RepID=D5CT91_SIDLE|nr:YqaJ viral recombinase family protein [Sideroxydans lithotrophicus]ADE12177.1 phage-type endonuclease [Sideroxydans lithotrophicus ES-1]